MKRLIGLCAAVMLVSGCSVMAPGYSPNVQSAQALKKGQYSKVSVEKVVTINVDINKISLRGSTLNSPYGGYDKYLEQALRQELQVAGLLADNAKTSLSAVFTKNDVDAAIGTGTADIAARFSVQRDGVSVYDKEHSVHHEWESSFVGAIAIPNAANAYPEVVNKLVVALFTDPEFKAAISQ